MRRLSLLLLLQIVAMKRNVKSKRVAFGGMITALSVLLMMLTGVIPVLIYSTPIIVGLFLMLMVIEMGKKWAIAVYFAVSVLSMFFVAEKESAVIYVAFFGYYPILKPIFESIKIRPVEWVLKFITFNVSMIAAYFVLINFFGVDISSDTIVYEIGILVLLALGNVLFLLYDIAFTRLVTAYVKIWSKFVRKFLK